MEALKPVSEILQPDPRNQALVRFDTFKPLTLEEHHAEAAAIQLNSAVPEDVRSYFATIRNVYLYAYFAYDLYVVVVFLTYTCIEMALRERLPINGKDKRTLKPLLEEAIHQNLITEKGFSHVRRMRQALAEDLRIRRRMGMKIPLARVPKSTYQQVLREKMPWFRNAFAHARAPAIYFPGDVVFRLRFTAEFINQLFASARRR